ncbi:MAG: hypothetical protein KKE20_01955 [Nanoarchaeota archaeon]|nr:hypothetical protein [Nanoarchaeota archaeon]
MKKVLIGSIILVLLVFLAGCQSAAEKNTEMKAEAQINAETGQDVDVDIDSSGGKMIYETDDGKVEIETNMKDVQEGDWCPAGGEWKMTATGQDMTEANWKIDKLITSGEYAGLCHVIYTVQTPEKEIKMDYWFDETGENGYYEMEMNGQKVKQEWHS